METWLILVTDSLTDNIIKQPTKSHVKNILCLLIIYFKMNMLGNFCKNPEHTKLINILLRNLAVSSSAVFESEVKIFWVAFEQLFLQSLLNFINESVNLTTDWIFAIVIVHLLLKQHDSLNSVEWKDDDSHFKYAHL